MCLKAALTFGKTEPGAIESTGRDTQKRREDVESQSGVFCSRDDIKGNRR